MDTRGLPSSSPSSSQAPYQRVPNLSSGPIMDYSYTSNTSNLPPAEELAHNNGTTGGYVYPSPSDQQLQFNRPASSSTAAAYDKSSNTPQNPYHNPFYPDHSQQHQDDDNNQLSSSVPLRLDNDNLSNDNHHDEDAESIVPAYLTTITPPGKILLLQTLTTLSTIVFTVLPVVIKAGPDATWGNWYTWQDAVRLIEPFISGLFHSWFFYSSDLMRRWNRGSGSDSQQENYRDSTVKRSGSWGDVVLDDKQGEGRSGEGEGDIPLNDRNQQQQNQYYSPSTTKKASWKQTTMFKALLANVFTFFLILYVTGAAIHTAAAFFKNILVLFLEQYSQGIGLSTHPPTTGDGQLSFALATQLKEGYLLIQDTWEHNISHYMYALGALGMSWCEMVAYSGQVLPVGVNLARVGQVSMNGSRLGVRSRKSSKRLVLLWILAGVLYGGIVAGVACQYPKGLYVGLIYVAALFLILVTYILSRPTRGLFTLGRHYILQTYLIGMVVATVAIVIYLAVHHFEFLTSNDKSHLASTTRP
ncbi:hypothetical protein BG015_009953 [Linnemannia schmuckeri]|uniref:Uncharacterized protein n=1 Tax=Linnemannia schmuckeri TaxID=64567 RepID=A0A9P5RY67_9FUNG|nr:hypothetical protein BG015_009953 [Linnemannia schmuckeri]